MKMWDNTRNWTLLLTIPSAVTTRDGGLCFPTPGFQRYVFRGISPLAAQSPRSDSHSLEWLSTWLAEGGRQTWSTVTCFHDIPSTGYMHTPPHSLYPLTALMRWGNKSPNTKAEGSFWAQRRALPASGNAKIRVIRTYACRSSWVVLRTLSTGRKSHYCFSFRRGKSSAVRRSGFPRSPRDTAGNPAAAVTPALRTSHARLRPERKPKRCIPTRINNPSAKLLKSFTRVTAAARSSSRWAEQRCAKCSSKRRQNPQQ